MSLEQDLKIIKDAELDIELLRRENDKLCQENNIKIEGLQDITNLLKLQLDGNQITEIKGYAAEQVLI